MSAGSVAELRLLPGRHKRARAGHPWIFSNEIDMTAAAKALPPGSVGIFREAGGAPLGTGFFNPHSLIAGRLLARDATPVDRALIARRIAAALALRGRLFDAPFYRLVHAEADGLPGLVVDRYGDVLVAEINAAGMERMTDDVLAALDDAIAPKAVLLKNDGPARALEGLPSAVSWHGAAPGGPIEIVENGVRFLADLAGGQKTGWFYDHRANRALTARFARSGRVLDLFSYLGGFGIQAAVAGASRVVMVDRSQPALDLAAESAARNGVAERCSFTRAYAFDVMESYAVGGERFDVVIADPPAFVKSRKDLAAGARGYRKMVRLAAPLVAPGGVLFAASCSHHVDATMFAEEVRRGLADARRDGRILYSGGAGPDHPVHPFLPESAYLKFQLLQLD
jgi:23S rRNA (cytosine1962-C5)-methyltransferase